MIQAVLFDMDGLMINSRELWRQATTKLLAEYGKVYNTEHAKEFSGLKSHDVARLLIKYYDLPTTPDSLSDARNQLMVELAGSPIQPMSGLPELLTLLDQLGHKKAVATSSYQAFAHQLLKSAGVFDKFEIIVTGEDVIHGKPAPDIFLHAAQRLGVSPKHCLVLEDAEVGVEAAHAAGMQSIAVNDHLPPHLFPHARHIFPTLDSITESILKDL